MKKKLFGVFAALILPVIALAWTVPQLATEFQNRVYVNQNYATLIPEAYYFFSGKASAYQAAKSAADQNPTMTDLHDILVASQVIAVSSRDQTVYQSNPYNYFDGRATAFGEAAALATP